MASSGVASKDTRKLVAILFSDIAGFTTAMGEDEERAIRAIELSRALQKDLVRGHRGRWHQEIGDGVLCTFESAVEAVRCALEIQRALRGTLALGIRIGIHVGDVVFRTTDEGRDIFGDGVNVASRLQGIAEPGGICVSERVCDDLRNHPEIALRDLGRKRLKNVNRAVRAYSVVDRDAAKSDGPRPVGAETRVALRRRRLLLAGLAAAAFVAGAALWWTAAPRTQASAFEAVRRELLGASGTGSADARVWTRPDPVENNQNYTILIEAGCDCAALLFAVDGSGQEIDLLYPNPFESPRRLRPGEPLEIPSSEAYRFRAVGGQGMDLLKLFVTTTDFDFPRTAVETWKATPQQSGRIEELREFLARVSDGDWGTAAAPLHITPE